MKRSIRFLTACTLFALLVGAALAQDAAKLDVVKPLLRTHAHNDYEHKRPLFEALENGFCSVEADIWLVDGKLLVAHNLQDAKPERTLEALYLDPLRERAKRNRGRIYKEVPSITLLIDTKSDAEPTYAVLREILKRYTDLFTRWENGKRIEKGVTAVISGNRAIETILKEKVRYCGIDGRLSDLESDATPNQYPLISQDWQSVSHWYATNGDFPAADKQKLAEIVSKAHRKGFRIRFWATGNSPILWHELYRDGVDLLNADDLPGLRHLLESEVAK